MQRRVLGLLFVVLALGLGLIGVVAALAGGRAWIIAVASAGLSLWMADVARRTLRR